MSEKTKPTVRFVWKNEYIQLSVLPEMGGRLFAATDKTNGYDFFYRQHVIKPALIGMLGAWISGGVEWCVFHHHRNTTFMPVDYTLAENLDGSRTIWFGEIERRHRMKWLIGLTLYPGKSYVEATVKFFNRTPQPQSILYWANVAVHVNDNYQVIFPPSVQAATYHSKIDFTHWPISRGTYRGHDYTDTDISWWKNSTPSNSFFAWDLQEDFMGGYDHGQQAGMVHVANHHIVGGAKLWEWGTGTYGRTWDKILTDEDGPYAELMVGAFSDNQPDYSWIKPYEVKTFTQFWYPVRDIGGFKNANLHGAVNLQLGADGTAAVGFYATSKHDRAKVLLLAGDRRLLDETIEIGPHRPFTQEVNVPAGIEETDLRAALVSADGKTLVSYQPTQRAAIDELPKPVKAPPKPEEIETIEQLYLTGRRVQQIHNPSVDPLEYYQEALKRDPGDSRCNLMLAINYNQRGMAELAEEFLRKSIERISAEYTRPGDTEAYFQLGLALRAQGRWDEAYEAFYRATWDYAFHSAAYYQLAELSCRKSLFLPALEQIERSLSTNTLNAKAHNLRAAILRKLGRQDQARATALNVLAGDPLNFLAMNELHLAQATSSGRNAGASESLARIEAKMRGEVQSYLELATDYMNWGMWDEAIDLLQRPVVANTPFAGTYPMVHYYLGYLYQQKGDDAQAARSYASAAKMPSDFCFPFRMEEIDVLKAAIQANRTDARAYYYLGNLLFDHQPKLAMDSWEKSIAIDDTLATVHRNLGWVHYRIDNDLLTAIECYERAVACDQREPRLFLELDRLYEFANVTPERRLVALKSNHDTVVQREDSFLREIMVLVLMGKYDTAIGYLANNYFHAREGSEEIHDVYVDAHLLRGLELMQRDKISEALEHFRQASLYPENLSVGRPKNDPRAVQVAYYTGLAHAALDNSVEAKQHFTQAARQADGSARREPQFYQAMALVELGKQAAAGEIFDALIRNGNQRLTSGRSSDFFAKFGQQETRQTRAAAAHFAIGLGFLGQGQTEKAKDEFKQATQKNASHVWAKYHLAAIDH